MIPALMIGLMKTSISGIDCGSVKSSSLTVKPTYKEHKTGYPQISDVKTLMYTESLFKTETEEMLLLPIVKQIALGLILGLPSEHEFVGLAPGIDSTALTISGTGFGNSSGFYGKANEFGYLTTEITCMQIGLEKGVAPTIYGTSIAVPDATVQAITLDSDNLLYGAPVVNGDDCLQAQFQAACKVKYLSLSWPPIIDAGIMESTEFSITGSLSNSTASTLDSIKQNMVPGTELVSIPSYIEIGTIGGTKCRIGLDGAIEADISFNPGNDWNGIDFKISSLLSDPSKIGTNWANFY